jgi:hypothetical protein
MCLRGLECRQQKDSRAGCLFECARGGAVPLILAGIRTAIGRADATPADSKKTRPAIDVLAASIVPECVCRKLAYCSF